MWYWDIPQDQWAASWAYKHRPVGPSLTLFQANREHVVQLLNAVPEALERRMWIRWPGDEVVEISVAWVVERQTRHVQGHLGDIREVHGV